MSLKHNASPSPTWRRYLKVLTSQQTYFFHGQRWIGVIKRFGMVGFLFFLIKGLLWLALPLWYLLFRP
jgi:hypothetical protein